MLSKSQYTKYVQCPKLFWLSCKKRDVLTPPSSQLQAIFNTGTSVGELACGLFPGGTEIEFNIKDISGMVTKTAELIASGETVIYEASFLQYNTFVAVDILVKNGDSWDIYEVKSSTSAKEIYRDDVAVQSEVIEASGLAIGTVNIVHINNKYTRNGELKLPDLFTVVDVTEDILDRRKNVSNQLQGMTSVLNECEPSIEIGPHCASPYECSAKEYCWRSLAHIPDYSIFNISRLNSQKKFDYYRQGIINIADITDTVGLTEFQNIQIRAEQSSGSVIDRESIKGFLSTFEYPITHLDFETFQQAVPQFDGVKPFEQIPFQYSIHIDENSVLRHCEFLGKTGTDPRRELALSLLKDTPKEGTILAYNSSLEKSVIRKLAVLFEDISFELEELSDRIVDLMTPFLRGWYYTSSMKGSYSIKAVLPALVPEMDLAYKKLEGIQNGGQASAAWSEMISSSDEKRAAIRESLLRYCELDTFAMVKVLDVLHKEIA